MSWKPLGSTVPQYHVSGSPASGYYLKAYQAGTTTAVNLATDTTGGTTMSKVQINSEGYPINGSSAVFIPHVGVSKYKLALYLNATDADNNTTGSAAWVVDNITIGSVSNATEYELGTSAATQSHNGISTGHVITTNYHDTNRVAGSGGTFQFTGTTDANDAGNWPHTDGYFYDADGKQFAITGVPNFEQWGAIGDGSTNDTAALQAATFSGVDIIECTKGATYKVHEEIAFTTDIVLIGNGAKIDGTFSGFTGSNVLSFTGTGLTQIEELGSNGVKGESSVTFASAPALVAGDIFIIANPTDSSWSGFRTTYKAGEYCEALSVTGSAVKLKNPLYDAYVVANVDVYKQSSITPVVSDLTVEGSDSDNVINLEYCRDTRLENVKVEHKNNSCIREKHCYGTRIVTPEYSNYGDGGDDYGWLVVASQHSRMIGGLGYARRHAVTMGGGTGTGIIPCRDIKAVAGTFRNDVASGVFNFDWHGHTEGCEASGCTIYGGATFQGKNNGYVDCDIFNYEGTEDVTVRGAEILGGRHYLVDCRLHNFGDPNTNTRGVVDFGGNSDAITSDTTETVFIEVKNCSVTALALSSSTSIVTVRNRGTTQKVNVMIDGLECNVNDMARFLFMDNVSGTADSDWIVVDNVICALSGKQLANIDANYLAFPMRMMEQSGAETQAMNTVESSTTFTAVTFKYAYPKDPVVTTSIVDASRQGNVTATLYIDPLAATGLTPVAYTADASNWSSAFNMTASWTARIREV